MSGRKTSGLPPFTCWAATTMSQAEAIKAEYTALRGELVSLKNCQVTYFWSSVTATGALIGFGGKIDQTSVLPYLAPLLIVLPCWLIFFDKARTITRIVGYTRILETIRISPTSTSFKYVGWENALRLFRHAPQPPRQPAPSRRGCLWDIVVAVGAGPLMLLRLLFLGPHHRYWSIIWLTFFFLCVSCLVVATLQCPKKEGTTAMLIVLSAVTAVVAAHNLVVLKKLNTGKNSYDENEKKWERLLGPQ